MWPRRPDCRRSRAHRCASAWRMVCARSRCGSSRRPACPAHRRSRPNKLSTQRGKLLVDEGYDVADAYGVWGEQRNIRSHFVIDADGKLSDVQVQVTPEESVARAVQAISG